MNTAIILAGGRGNRMNAGMNKAYLQILGKPILAYTIEAFHGHKLIDEIILVLGENEENICKNEILNKMNYSKIKKIVRGGKERQNSVYNGLIQISTDSDIILIHDGARPFITEDIITRCIQGAKVIGAVTTAVPVKDTIKVVKGNKLIDYTLDREKLWATQTPQGFKKELILEAHKKALQLNYNGTDDAMLVEKQGIDVGIVEGSYENIKITTPEDLIIAEIILNNKTKEESFMIE